MRITWEEPEPYPTTPNDVLRFVRTKPNEKLIGWMRDYDNGVIELQLTPESKLLKVMNSYHIPIDGRLIIEAE